MQRFVYSPEVMAFVLNWRGEIIDLSSDIISGSVQRNLDAVSHAELILQNPKHKYTNDRQGNLPIKPMDRIIIFLQRIHKPVQAFAGFVDDAPFKQLYPGPVRIGASCTLKRLQYTYWDPGLPAVQTTLKKYGWNYDYSTGNLFATKGLEDMDARSGVGHLVLALMRQGPELIRGYPPTMD
jgi:hypothetical protein